MPDELKQIFKKKEGGSKSHIRKRKGIYEIRIRFHGVNITASSKSLKTAKEKFFQKLKEVEEDIPNVPTTFTAFSLFYYENFRKRKVSPFTYKRDLQRLKKYLIPCFGDKPLKSITPFSVQRLLDDIKDKGLEKTADECHSILNCTFKMAIAHCVMQSNPIATVFHTSHERKSGKALSKEEEAKLLSESGTLKIYFAFALYTGLRPNEYYTAQIEGRMIIAVNSKRKHKRVEYKRIPISPMLEPHLVGVEKLDFPTLKYLREKFRAILPSHRLYDLRTTFYTRCKECGVGDAARDEMMGHSLGKLGNAYTDLSDEYLFREAKKLLY